MAEWQTFAPTDQNAGSFSLADNGSIEFQFPEEGGDGVFLKSLNIGEIITYKLIPELGANQGVFVTNEQVVGAPQVSLTTGSDNTLHLEWRSEAGGDLMRWDLRDLTEADAYFHLVSHRFTTYLYTSSDGAIWSPEIALDLPGEQAAYGGLQIRSENSTNATSPWLGTHSIFFADVPLEKTGETSETGETIFTQSGDLLAGTYEVYVKGQADEATDELTAQVVLPSGETLLLNTLALGGDSLWEFAGHADLAAGYTIQLTGDGSEEASVRLLGSGWDDEDGDGMPDVWEEANGLDPTVADANEDIDGDGVPNILELFQGSDPTAANSTGDAAGTIVYVDPAMGSDHFDGWRRLRVAGRSLGPKKSYQGAAKALSGGGGSIQIKGGTTVHEVDVIGPGVTIIPEGDVIFKSSGSK